MGDRGNIVVKQEGRGDVWLYTHWSGSDIKTTVRDALKRGKSRWTDEPYLTRIIFDELTGGDRGLTGYGITTGLTDNGNPILVVWPEKQEVSQHVEDTKNGVGYSDPPQQSWTFEEFAALPDSECEFATEGD